MPDAGKPAASGGGPDSGGEDGGGDGKEGTAPAPDATYANCAAAREAGAAPLHRGDPGYSRSLDRDGDGVACDT
ncbi:excalibur calcium-binding domain-containing protein [Actinacidiphila glaucinigra]